jgi:hypothetical protein
VPFHHVSHGCVRESATDADERAYVPVPSTRSAADRTARNRQYTTFLLSILHEGGERRGTRAQVRLQTGCQADETAGMPLGVELVWLSWLALVLAFPLLNAVHEACHVAGALLGGLRPYAVALGHSGPIVFRAQVGAVTWRVHKRFSGTAA